MGSKNEMMIWTTEPIDAAFTHNWGAKVKGSIGGREPQGFLVTFQEAQPHWEEIVQIDRVNEVCNIQTRQRILRRVADQGGQEEASG